MPNEFKPIETQEAFDAAIKERLARERRKVEEQYGDYADLKAKAAKYDEAQEAAKTELEKATERAQRAEAEAQSLKAAKERSDLAAKVSAATGVPAGLIQGDDEAAMTASAQAIAGWAESQGTRIPGDKGGAASGHRKPLPDSEIEKMTDQSARVMEYSRGYEAQ